MTTLDRTQIPKVFPATDFNFKLSGIEHDTLSNGAKLYSLNSGVQKVVKLEIYFPAGLIYESQKTVAKAAASLLKSGTSQHTALEINTFFENVGASLNSYSNNDYAIISLSCLSKHLTKLLPLIHEIITDAQFPESELAIYKAQSEQGLQVNLKKGEFVANRLIDEYIFGFDHPYGGYVRTGDFDKLNTALLRNFVTQHYNLQEAKIFISGRFPEQYLEEIKSIFGQDTSDVAPSTLNLDTVNPHQEKKHSIINDETSVQGAIRIGKAFVPNTHDDFTPMQFVNTLFGGYFGSRLMSNIREDKGYTYGIYSYVQSQQHGCTYMVATEAGKDVAEKAVQEVWNEMKRLQEEKVPEAELQLVKNYILGSILGSIDGPFKIMGRWKGLILNDFEQSRFDRSIDIYKNITTEDIQALAQKYYNKDSFYELIVY